MVAPTETSVSMVVPPWRRARSAPRWKVAPTQKKMGTARMSWTGLDQWAEGRA